MVSRTLYAFLFRSSVLIRRDRWLYGLIGLYVVCASIVQLYFSRDAGRALSLYFGTWLAPGLDALLAYVVVKLLWGGYRERHATVRTPFARRLGQTVTPEVLANVALYAAVTVFFGAFTGLKCTFPLIRPFYFDATLADWERTLHPGLKVWSMMRALFAYKWANMLVLINYYAVWPALCTFSPLVVAFLKDRRLRYRYLLCYLLAWILFGTVLALMFMSAGPVFYDQIHGGDAQFAEMQSYLKSHGMIGGPTYLWETYKAGGLEIGAGISAFPSMHVTISVLATCLAWSLRRWLGVVMTAFTALILLSSMYLGWHYLAGDYIVVPLALLLWRCTAPATATAARRGLAVQQPAGRLLQSTELAPEF